ncbi:MAG: DUF4173 domain-containing protein [Gemmatimonadaceae bacterium]
MTPTLTSTRARQLLAASVLLGVTGDLLWGSGMARLGFMLWILFAIAVAWWCGSPGDRQRSLLLTIIGAAALAFVLRDSERLLVLDVLVALGACALVVWRAQGFSLTAIRLTDGPRAVLMSAVASVAGAVALAATDAKWDDGGSPAKARAFAVTLGTLVAVPVLAVTLTLLGEADPLFAGWVEALLGFVSEDLVRHVVMSAAVGWLVAGWLRGGVVPTGNWGWGGAAERWHVGLMALAPTLYAMIVALAAFLGLQGRTLVGGAEFVERTTGLTYAAYARGGFFELVAVALIVLGVLLVSDVLLDRAESRDERRFRSAAWMLLALVGLLAGSAAYRMSLYVNAYGLTEERFFAVAGMVWIVAALGWFGASVLRGRRGPFPVGLVALSVGWIFALNLVGPDALVARVNLARARSGLEFDVAYHANRLADAVPTLVAGASALPAERCHELLAALLARDGARTATDWRGWSLSSARARRALEPGLDRLVAEHCRGS